MLSFQKKAMALYKVCYSDIFKYDLLSLVKNCLINDFI